jgi:hypothetical protein
VRAELNPGDSRYFRLNTVSFPPEPGVASA